MATTTIMKATFTTEKVAAIKIRTTMASSMTMKKTTTMTRITDNNCQMTVPI